MSLNKESVLIAFGNWTKTKYQPFLKLFCSAKLLEILNILLELRTYDMLTDQMDKINYDTIQHVQKLIQRV